MFHAEFHDPGGQLDDFEKAMERKDVNWILDQFSDDIVRKLSDGIKIKGKMSCAAMGEDFFQALENIDVEPIDFVT